MLVKAINSHCLFWWKWCFSKSKMFKDHQGIIEISSPHSHSDCCWQETDRNCLISSLLPMVQPGPRPPTLTSNGNFCETEKNMNCQAQFKLFNHNNTRYHLTISREEMYSQRYRPWMPKGHSRWISLERKRDSRLEVCFSARTKRAREPSERGPSREVDWQPRLEVPFVWVQHQER